MAEKTVKVRLVKGLRGCQARHRLSVKALGLNKLHATKEVEATPQILGMVRKVTHLVTVEEVK